MAVPEKLIKELITRIGDNPNREGLKDTPRRVAKTYEKLFSGYKKNPKSILTVFSDEKYDEMIIVKDIEFYSTCEHHILPFFGKAHIGYIPNGKIIGISKIPRLVEIYARRLQNQERLTFEIAEGLNNILNPRGVGVILEAQHLCMMCRGVKKQNSKIITSSLKGLFKNNFNTRSEFLKLIER